MEDLKYFLNIRCFRVSPISGSYEDSRRSVNLLDQNQYFPKKLRGIINIIIIIIISHIIKSGHEIGWACSKYYGNYKYTDI
jgi:hypothetical protein